MSTDRIRRALLFLLPALLAAGPASAHIGSAWLTDDCGSCHVGHGKSGEPMLAKSEEEFCYQCHGSDSERTRMVSEGRLVAMSGLKDLRAEFDKAYAHPVERSMGTAEPRDVASLVAGELTRAECVDCHNPHRHSGPAKKAGLRVSGYSLGGQILENSMYEYEICLKCHAEDRLAGEDDTSLVRAFAATVRSQHPVTVARADGNSPSLVSEWAGRGRMDCSDCHRSDDADAPAGPHGSNHEFLLAGNYDRGVTVTESSLAYEFCYGCHDRFSILGNESFPYHREHVEGDLLTGRRGTSCYTCHASHGAPRYPNLIRFNPQAVSRLSNGLPVRYESTGPGTGSCVLECHGYEHSPGRY